MIILLGPDGTGKTTLAKRLESIGLKYYHFTKDSGYLDYISPLCALEMSHAVLDRHALCEYPYSTCMSRQFKFTLKQWHNILTMTLIQNPVIVLCTHKPAPADYDNVSQYLPYELWDKCLALYREFLSTHYIPFTEYDYSIADVHYAEHLTNIQARFNIDTSWWRQHWLAGYGCAGSASPKFLLVAERIGPNNIHNIPFEAGPTGNMLSNMFYETGTPLGSIAVTNMVKSFRRDPRNVNAQDIELFEEEIAHLQPKKVIFMGSTARKGIPIAKAHNCDVGTLVHLGALNHKGITDMSGYHNEWRKLIGIVPTVRFT